MNFNFGIYFIYIKKFIKRFKNMSIDPNQIIQ